MFLYAYLQNNRPGIDEMARYCQANRTEEFGAITADSLENLFKFDFGVLNETMANATNATAGNATNATAGNATSAEAGAAAGGAETNEAAGADATEGSTGADATANSGAAQANTNAGASEGGANASSGASISLPGTGDQAGGSN
jgi:hypothetical protein